MLQNVLLILFICLLLPAGVSAGHLPCECTGKTTDHKYQGGDKNPLTYYSLQRLEHPATGNSEAQYCYERKVTNHSKDEVRDVSWTVAGYWSRVLPPQTENCCCQVLPLAGSLAIPHPTGPIHYGPGSRTQYVGTAYAPKNGWPQFTAGLTPVRDISVAGSLGGTFEVAIRTSSGQYKPVTLYLTSIFFRQPKTDGFYYQYEFRNLGTEPLRVFWDVPRTSEFQAQFAMHQNQPLLVRPEMTEKRQVKSADPPAKAIVAVFIHDANGDLAARGMASVYGPRNGKTTLRHATNWPDIVK